MNSFFNVEDPITNVVEYMTNIRDLTGVSSASLVVSYILLERFVAAFLRLALEHRGHPGRRRGKARYG